ncbi:MAG: hypothetical protein ABR878_17715 [Roseiarcus sp.]
MTADVATDRRERLPERRRLYDLIAESKNWLTARISHHAKERSYTPFTDIANAINIAGP